MKFNRNLSRGILYVVVWWISGGFQIFIIKLFNCFILFYSILFYSILFIILWTFDSNIYSPLPRTYTVRHHYSRRRRLTDTPKWGPDYIHMETTITKKYIQIRINKNLSRQIYAFDDLCTTRLEMDNLCISNLLSNHNCCYYWSFFSQFWSKEDQNWLKKTNDNDLTLFYLLSVGGYF